MAYLWIMEKDGKFAKTNHIHIVRIAEKFDWQLWCIITSYKQGKNKVVSKNIKTFQWQPRWNHLYTLPYDKDNNIGLIA